MVRAPRSDDVTPAESAGPTGRRPLRAVSRELFRLRLDKSAARVGLVVLGFAVMFLGLGARLVMLAVAPEQSGIRRATSSAISAARPDIIDRNGETLATDVKTVS